VLRRQLRQGRSHRLPFQPAPEVRLLEQPELAALVQDQAIEFRRLSWLAAAVTLQDPQGAAARDRAQPGGKLRRFLQLRQGLEGKQQGFLRHVAGRFVRAKHLIGNRDHRSPVAAHQFIIGVQVADQGADHQFLVVGSRQGVPAHRHSNRS
jgi:hypothetical protein